MTQFLGKTESIIAGFTKSEKGVAWLGSKKYRLSGTAQEQVFGIPIGSSVKCLIDDDVILDIERLPGSWMDTIIREPAKEISVGPLAELYQIKKELKAIGARERGLRVRAKVLEAEVADKQIAQDDTYMVLTTVKETRTIDPQKFLDTFGAAVFMRCATVSVTKADKAVGKDQLNEIAEIEENIIIDVVPRTQVTEV